MGYFTDKDIENRTRALDTIRRLNPVVLEMYSEEAQRDIIEEIIKIWTDPMRTEEEGK